MHGQGYYAWTEDSMHGQRIVCMDTCYNTAPRALSSGRSPYCAPVRGPGSSAETEWSRRSVHLSGARTRRTAQ